MRLPATQPVNDPTGLWSLQLELLATVESLLGPREASKKIYQPQFTDYGPLLRNTPALDGAYVELSRNGRHYWPTVVFEMSHETVHLLNPIPGNTNNLEEGVAIAFSLHVQSSYGISIPVSMPSYLYALRLVQALPEGPLGAAARVRRQVGSFSAATPQCLVELFPEVDGGVLANLAGAGVVRSAKKRGRTPLGGPAFIVTRRSAGPACPGVTPRRPGPEPHPRP